MYDVSKHFPEENSIFFQLMSGLLVGWKNNQVYNYIYIYEYLRA